MPRQKFLRVRNFERLQHYKERAPVWIKLYVSILDDYHFQQLTDAERFHAVGLMLLASRLNNKLPNDAVWLQKKIGATEAINLERLLEAEFLEFIKSENSGRKAKVKPSNVVPFKSKENFNKDFNEQKKAVIGSNVLKLKGDSASNSLAQRQNRRETEKETHTETDAPAAESVRSNEQRELSGASENRVVCFGSEFSKDEIGRYVDYCIAQGQAVRNRAALITKLKQTGDADEFILEFLKPKEFALAKFGEPRRFHETPCQVCFGSKMEIIKDKGSRLCPHCLDEQGRPTGKEPFAEN
jgi:hypothetical protein